jgi:hypothetical protein
MTVAQRILALLGTYPEGLSDREIAERLGLPRPQRANSVCRHLARAGLVTRRNSGDSIRTLLVAPDSSAAGDPADVPAPAMSGPKPWFWEGNVVIEVANALRRAGWTIESVADTASRQRGEDIRARRGGELLLVEVKGYPSNVYERGPLAGEPKRTAPTLQAKHWMAEALMAALLRRSVSPECRSAIAVPHFPRYVGLLDRLRAPLQALRLDVLLVHEDGRVLPFDCPPVSLLASKEAVEV